MARIVYGNATENNFLTAAISNTNPVTTDAMDAREADFVGVQLVTATVSGAWKIEVSNDYVVPGSVGALAYGQPGNTGTWSDITAAFVPAIAAVVSGVSGENQYVQAEICARAIRYTFTPSSGTGTAKAIGCMKAHS